MDIRRVTRGALWIAPAGVLVALGLYAGLVAVNWHDEAPSSDAQRLHRIVDDRPKVADADNGYVLMLGLGVAKDQDSLVWGRARKAFLENFRPSDAVNEIAAFPGKDVGLVATTAPAFILGLACSEGREACADQLRGDPGQVDRWLESEAWRLDRYLVLTGYTQWHESIPTDLRAPIPHYMPGLDGQKLALLKAWQHAHRAEGAAALELLEKDLAFWRMVLRSSDLLISKMMAAAAIDRHFKLGNLVLRELRNSGAEAAPPLWRVPIDREERSLRRVLAGEWRYSESALDLAVEQAGKHGHSLTDRALKPLF